MLSATNKLFFFSFLGIILLGEVTPGNALVRRYRFELGTSSHSRLCTSKTMMTINGQFPGPTIYARRGDLVIVDVINRAQENITLHWHGVKMRRYPWSDGPAYVTQCPITPGNKFTQRVILSDEEGTLWWHAHSDWSRATVHGAIVILPPEGETYPFPKPHAEVPILLGEWWNTDVNQVMKDFLRDGRDPVVCDAFLINGQPGDLFPCSTQDIYKLRVEWGKTYLIRMVNAAIDFIMFFKIYDHKITVVGADGSYLKPFTSDYIVISPGQTFDFLLEANQPPSRYYMASRVYAVGGQFNKNITTGYVEYIGNYAPPSSPPLPSFPPYDYFPAIASFTNQFRSLANDKYPVDVPKNVTRNLFFTLSVNLQPCPGTWCNAPFGDMLRSSVNNVTMVLPKTAILEAYYWGISGVYDTNFPDEPIPFNYTNANLNRDHLRTQPGTEVSVLEYNSTVELVFQGTNLADGVEHPMHLHGYNFYVVGSGLGNFDGARDPAKYNLIDPPLMQTINVPRKGWIAIRFKANNPGVWYLHCHFERHISWGMGMVFIVSDGKRLDEKMLPPPPDMPWCSNRVPRFSPSSVFDLSRQ